ncbi:MULTISPECIES: basic amino acid ABC transporter substrate-binding protein [Pseudothermotoga]|uniref:Extracellular solute-binding protein family 3 n=1 Tax=Pseudothermotoga lettingae (strain ATCC BAA-301 / DSM 14385 / NBRC 107922 / TMO) TaxID=416591 RepID=A8F5J2_PSELT|nr:MULTISPECIES: basic amino acid ABC transporter substrate-binding protein [Pseudothermotoga]ABV33426.1 extracellular solute-binding protein family 3 [Pseudothermotoga lettingae TMO]KUK21119.1 MAG: Extracellular solute-binding protein family 3 [Pseudothermotoga lettingae]MDI3495855.1 polar amino acid transport system substrate-binding protein [Pseudothermotoga sp.]MDK2883925.1 polar amino acid transport system substrate-binding protein [Pseudothermotoga sp.]GLI49660.1 basic amino acid ABC tra
MKFTRAMFLILILLSAMTFSRTITVGTSADFPPFEYIENGQFVGFDMDLMREIAKIAGFDLKFVDMSFDSLIPALRAGQVDVVAAAMTITDERKQVVDFSIPYWTADQSVIVKSESPLTITVLFSKGKIGVQTGTTGDLWCTDNLVSTGMLPEKNLKRYDTFVLALSDLLNGNIDAIVLDSPVANRFAATKPVRVVGIITTGEQYGVAVRKGEKELLEKINNAIKVLNESGKMSELIDKYF